MAFLDSEFVFLCLVVSVLATPGYAEGATLPNVAYPAGHLICQLTFLT